MARFKQSLPAVSALYFQRSFTWLNVFFFLVTGISLGIFTELSLPEDHKTQVGLSLMEHLFRDPSTMDSSQIFFQSAGNHLGLLSLIFLSGLTSMGIPVALATVSLKGAALGFSAALLLESMEDQGMLTLLLAVVPSNILLLPALMLAASAALNQIYGKKRRDGRKRSLSLEPGPYCISFLLPVLFVLMAAVIEGTITPALLQLTK